MQNLPQEIQEFMNEFGKQHVESSKKNRLTSFRKLNPLVKKKGIVFIGDSITEGFPICEMYQGSSPIYNRGVGGDTSIELSQKLQETVFDLEPSQVILLIGTNDLIIDNNPEKIIQRIKEICLQIKGTLPATRILVQSIYPINNSDDPTVTPFIVGARRNEDIRHINKMIYELTNQLGIEYIDLYSKLSDDNGNLKIAYTTDGIHLSIDGYVTVYDQLEKHLLD